MIYINKHELRLLREIGFDVNERRAIIEKHGEGLGIVLVRYKWKELGKDDFLREVRGENSWIYRLLNK